MSLSTRSGTVRLFHSLSVTSSLTARILCMRHVWPCPANHLPVGPHRQTTLRIHAWWGFTNASDRHRVDDLLRRSIHCGYFPADFPPLDQCKAADRKLFDRIQSDVYPLLDSLLPPPTAASQIYNMRSRPHNRQLPRRSGHLIMDSHFITGLQQSLATSMRVGATSSNFDHTGGQSTFVRRSSVPVDGLLCYIWSLYNHCNVNILMWYSNAKYCLLYNHRPLDELAVYNSRVIKFSILVQDRLGLPFEELGHNAITSITARLMWSLKQVAPS